MSPPIRTIPFAAIALLIFWNGCSSKTQLIATPALMVGQNGVSTFSEMPKALRGPMQIIYAADRDIVHKSAFGIQYGSGRSGKLAVGVAEVGFDQELSWEQLTTLCTKEIRPRPQLSMQMKSVREIGLLAVPLQDMEVREGRYRLTPEGERTLTEGKASLHDEIRQRLKHTPLKDVYLYVHGFNNTFEDAIFRLAMVYHFAGRPGVPIAYTWPAGRGGLTGYAYDRESGEFTVFHLKKFIEAVASCPDVERLHIIAHSRGTDVAVSALRELNIEIRAKNLRTQEQLKLENLVLAAPDMDPDVFEQRFAIEDLHLAARRTTVYLSRADFALATARLLFGDSERLGSLTPEKLTPDARAKLAALKNFSMIDCQVTGFSTSHDYAFAHPAVVSDMILLLRDNRDPGPETGRPLEPKFEGVWQITNDYLRIAPSTQPVRPQLGNFEKSPAN